jgi:hypothetical protein
LFEDGQRGAAALDRVQAAATTELAEHSSACGHIGRGGARITIKGGPTNSSILYGEKILYYVINLKHSIWNKNSSSS